MEVKAKAKFIRMSPKKVRLVIGVIRGMNVDEALDQLKFMKKDAAIPVKKLLDSAVANAVHNFNLKREDLFIKTIVADGGPVFKRWQPKAFGRATPIRKRTTHISIVLDEKGKEAKVAKDAKAAKASSDKAADKKTENKKSEKTGKKPEKKKIEKASEKAKDK